MQGSFLSKSTADRALCLAGQIKSHQLFLTILRQLFVRGGFRAGRRMSKVRRKRVKSGFHRRQCPENSLEAEALPFDGQAKAGRLDLSAFRTEGIQHGIGVVEMGETNFRALRLG